MPGPSPTTSPVVKGHLHSLFFSELTRGGKGVHFLFSLKFVRKRASELLHSGGENVLGEAVICNREAVMGGELRSYVQGTLLRYSLFSVLLRTSCCFASSRPLPLVFIRGRVWIPLPERTFIVMKCTSFTGAPHEYSSGGYSAREMGR